MTHHNITQHNNEVNNINTELNTKMAAMVKVLQTEKEKRQAVELKLDNKCMVVIPVPVATCSIGSSTNISAQDIDDAMCRALRKSDQYQDEAKRLQAIVNVNEQEKIELRVQIQSMKKKETEATTKIERFKSNSERIEQWYEESLQSETIELNKKLNKQQQKHQRVIEKKEQKTRGLEIENVALMNKLKELCVCLELEQKKKKQEKVKKKKVTLMNVGDKRAAVESLRITCEKLKEEKKKREIVEKENRRLQMHVNSL